MPPFCIVSYANQIFKQLCLQTSQQAMPAYSIPGCPLPCCSKLASFFLTFYAMSGIPTEAEFQVSLLSRVGGGWGETKIKAKLSPAGAGAWAELGKKKKLSNLVCE